MGLKTDIVQPQTRVLIAAVPRKEGRDEAATGKEEEARRSEAECLRLPHPATGQPASFLYSSDGMLQELNVYRPPFGAWFAGQRAISDGGLWIATPVDPLLLLLPRLEESRHATEAKPEGVFIDLATAFVGSPLEPIARKVAERGQLDCVCVRKVLGSHSYYRLDDRRVDAWLDLKVEAAKAGLQGSASAALSALEGPGLTDYAVGLLTEYLPAALAERLCQRNNAELGKKQQATPEQAPSTSKWVDVAAQDAAQAERSKGSTNAEAAPKRPKLDLKEIAKQRAKDRAKAVKAEQKAAQIRRETRGMAPLASFFKKG